MATIILLLQNKIFTNKSKSNAILNFLLNLTENLVVIYLSLDREEPTDYSLRDFKVKQ